MLPEQEQKNVTLRAFVSPNDKLLTAISVLGGLTLLFSVIDKGAAFYFVSFFIFVVLARELNSMHARIRRSTSGKISGKLQGKSVITLILGT